MRHPHDVHVVRMAPADVLSEDQWVLGCFVLTLGWRGFGFEFGLVGYSMGCLRFFT